MFAAMIPRVVRQNASTGLLAVMFLVALPGSHGTAATTTYTDEAAFVSVLQPGFYRNTFSTIPDLPASPIPAPTYVVGNAPVAYTVSSPPTGLFSDTFPGPLKAVGNWGYSLNVDVQFSSGNVRQVGFNVFLCDFPGTRLPGAITVNFSDGTSAEVPSYGPGNPYGFIGLSADSTAVIDSLTIVRGPTDAYLNLGNIYTSSIGGIARFWTADGNAASYGGSGTWDTTSTLWAVDGTTVAPWQAGSKAMFAGSGGSVTVSPGGVSVARGLSFVSGDYTIDGPGAISLTGTQAGANAIFVGTGTTTYENGSTSSTAGAAVVNATVNAPNGFTKTGFGTLIVGGTATGPAVVSQGVLQIGNGGTTGVLAAATVVNNTELEFNRADEASFAGSISGAGAVYVTGLGRVTLSGSSSYTGRTGVLASGTLAVATAAAVATSAQISTGGSGVFDVSSLAGGYTVSGSQTLTGGGRVLGSITMSADGTVSPGEGRGILTVGDGITFGSGGNYNWQMEDALIPPGQPGGWDLLSGGGTLSITATPQDPFLINLWTVDSTGLSVPAFNFSPTENASWTIVSATGGIAGFAANKFLVNTSAANGTGGFVNELDGGTFSIARAGNDLNLVFTASGAVPTVITIDVASGTQSQTDAGYPLLTGATPVVKTGAGTLVIDQANTLTGSTTVQTGVLQLANAAALSASELVVIAGGTGQVAPFTSTSVAGLDLSGNGLVDLTTGALTISSGLSPVALVAELLEGRSDGSWNGSSGITSSTAAAEVASGIRRSVGWLDNGDGSLTVAYAAPGDTNIDWSIDILDAANFLALGKFDTTAPATWIEGDFNYDGFVDILDAADFVSTGLFNAGNYNAAPSPSGAVAAVPEPSSAWAGFAGGLALAIGHVARRRRSKPAHVRAPRRQWGFAGRNTNGSAASRPGVASPE